MTYTQLSGFYQKKGGVSYHDKWLTASPSDESLSGNQWILSCDQNGLYRANGVQVGTSDKGTSDVLTIQGGPNGGETSDWAVQLVIAFDRKLTAGEITSVEATLMASMPAAPVIAISGSPLSVTSGLVGAYTANSWDSKTNMWKDISGNENHVKNIKGNIIMNTPAGAAPYLSGAAGTSSMMWPSAVLPPTFTLFHIAKYNGPTRGRIFTGLNGNWVLFLCMF